MLKKILTTICLTLMISQSGFAATVSEQELEQIKKQVDELINGANPLEQRDLTECAPILTQVYDAETLEFLAFLEDNFANKASTSSLSNIAIIRYTQYKTKIESEFARLSAPSSSGSGEENITFIEFASFQQCSEITDMYLEMAKDAMMRHIESTAAAKRTTIFLERYKGINSKLSDLNFQISMMYSNYMTFKNKLPGFIAKCI